MPVKILSKPEELVLLAVLKLADNAYGVTIRKEIEARTGRAVSIGAIYPTLDRLEANLFRGESRDIGSARVFGGQVLGQALIAACTTVEERIPHSLHAYFLRSGDFNAPIVYEVERNRDGRSFSSRRVVAIQHGRPIFTMAASFQVPEAGTCVYDGDAHVLIGQTIARA